MKASELIKSLQHRIRDYGDTEVFISNRYSEKDIECTGCYAANRDGDDYTTETLKAGKTPDAIVLF